MARYDVANGATKQQDGSNTPVSGTSGGTEQVTGRLEGSRKSLAAALARIEMSFGRGAVMRMGERPHTLADVVSTGSLGLDLAPGIGGMPKGRVIEIYGPESSGKTTLALHIIAEAQKKGGTCAFLDAEHALNSGYARRLGVNVDDLLISQTDGGEQMLEIADTLVRSSAVTCWWWTASRRWCRRRSSKAGVVEKSGAWFSCEGTRIGQGRENAKQFLRDNLAMAEGIEKRIRSSNMPMAHEIDPEFKGDGDE